MAWLMKFVFDGAGKWLLGAAGLLSIVVMFASEQRQVGALKQAQKQEKVDAKVVRRGAEAARQSLDPAARGVRDPNAAAE